MKCNRCGKDSPMTRPNKRFCSEACMRTAKEAARNHRVRDRNRAKVQELKDKPCADCGIVLPHYCMDFDHRDPSQKTAKISQLIATKRLWENIQAEIDKCDLVCANCH